jgi:hypothetical protein
MANRVTVILSDEELEAAREMAGAVPLSAWFRRLAFPPLKIVRMSDVEPKEEEGAGIKPDLAARARAMIERRRR